METDLTPLLRRALEKLPALTGEDRLLLYAAIVRILFVVVSEKKS